MQIKDDNTLAAEITLSNSRFDDDYALHYAFALVVCLEWLSICALNAALPANMGDIQLNISFIAIINLQMSARLEHSDGQMCIPPSDTAPPNDHILNIVRWQDKKHAQKWIRDGVS